MEASDLPPKTFRVGVLGPGGGGGSFGELTITHREAVVTSWPARRELARHERRQVTVVRPRIDLFGRRTVYALNGPYGTVGVRLGSSPQRELEEAFLAAGFEFDERRTFFIVLITPPFRPTHAPGRRRA